MNLSIVLMVLLSDQLNMAMPSATPYTVQLRNVSTGQTTLLKAPGKIKQKNGQVQPGTQHIQTVN